MYRILFLMVGVRKASVLKTLIANIALAVLAVGSANAHAQSDTQPAVHNHTEITAAQLDHQHPNGTTHEHNVEHMLELLNVPAQVNKAAADILSLYSAKISPDNTNPNLELIFDAYQRDATRLVYATLGWDNMKTAYIGSYASRMDEDDAVQVIPIRWMPMVLAG